MKRHLLFLAAAGLAHGQTNIIDSGVTLDLIAVATIPDSGSGSSAPARVSVVTEDPQGRLFANDQRGALYFIEEATGTAIEYLDLNDYPAIPVRSTNEGGFQSFAFHPDFHVEGAGGFGRFYTIHSCSNDTPTPDFDTPASEGFHTLLLEWATTAPAASEFVPASAAAPYRELLRIDQPFGNHNAGLIAFNPTVAAGNPDYGMLYVALGDGGSGNDPEGNGQNAGNPLGAILRIDPLGNNSANGAYGIPADNVFAADADPGTLAENYCIGLRNPQRFGWDLVTGQAFIADIGQGLFEEINLMSNGGNFGWVNEEGSGGAPTFIDPVSGYFHATDFAGSFPEITNRAVTCGEVLRGTCISGMEGVLLLSDFPNGRVFQLDVDSDPLDGGVDGLSEVRFREGGGSRSIFLDLINAARAARGLSATTRADIRFSVNTPGRLFISNKRDGIIRRVVPDQDPAISLEEKALEYTGLLEESDDLRDWRLVRPQPPQEQAISYDKARRFLRSVRR